MVRLNIYLLFSGFSFINYLAVGQEVAATVHLNPLEQPAPSAADPVVSPGLSRQPDVPTASPSPVEEEVPIQVVEDPPCVDVPVAGPDGIVVGSETLYL